MSFWISAGGLIAGGFLLGSLIGARLATQLPKALLGPISGGATVLIGLRMVQARQAS